MEKVGPVSEKERIQSLDILRGFAVLGILIMNIQSFSMPEAAYLNPMAYGSMEGINKWVFDLCHILADSKFMAIFSILFGAGMVLFAERAKKKSSPVNKLHLRRNVFLLIFGLIHAHLIWMGDILVIYALCGFIVFWFHKKSPKTLFILGIIFLAVHSIIAFFAQFSFNFAPEEVIAEASKAWIPPQEWINNEIGALTGGFSERISHISSASLKFETFVFLYLFLWRAGGLMLIGMSLYKLGILSAKKTMRYYRNGFLIGAIVGFPIVILGLYMNYQKGWAYQFSQFSGTQFNYWGSLLICYSYISLVMLISKSDGFNSLKKRLAAVGRMAFTNYIMQSILCTFIFYGWGLALFGQFERWQQIIVVLGVWIIQILWSYPWLQKFKFGPLEWLWRSLTYAKLQPFRK